MVNYAGGFNQPDTGKYYERIIIDNICLLSITKSHFFNKEAQKNEVEVNGYGVANGGIWGKQDRRITISEHKQYFNDSYAE